MAGTKTHPIKSTLKEAIEYICDPDKTERWCRPRTRSAAPDPPAGAKSPQVMPK